MSFLAPLYLCGDLSSVKAVLFFSDLCGVQSAAMGVRFIAGLDRFIMC